MLEPDGDASHLEGKLLAHCHGSPLGAITVILWRLFCPEVQFPWGDRDLKADLFFAASGEIISTDIVGRHFKRPKEGLGFDDSPSAHMWRIINWPTSYL